MSFDDWWVSLSVGLLGLVSYLRWLRVAQREHYEPGRIVAMIGIWLRATPVNIGLGLVIVLLCAAGALLPEAAILAAVLWLVWPLGLPLHPKGSPLVVTDRVKRLAAIVVVLHVVLVSASAAVGAFVPPFLIVPIVLEAALRIAAPIERRLSATFLVQAAAKIKRVAPRVVAITGSYGKTSTKNYATHLLSGRWSTLASPASFNNAMGLSRAVNDRLEPGTDVFVAEMGTYGPGEIAGLCEIFRPEVSAITTIGEAHLERMKDRATIVRAKSEILAPASTVVLNVDVPELADAADRASATQRVIRVSAADAPGADVVVRREGDDVVLVLAGERHQVSLPPETGHLINVAVAVGLAMALDVPTATILDRLPSIPATPHRAETTRTPDGLTVIDDTYNSNPDGAAAALASAKAIAGSSGTVFTITPGMVELGSQQATRNAELARAATDGERTLLCIVGRTNLAALSAGEPSRTLRFASREQAASHVMARAAAGDVVLYENDLPDHYP